MPFARCVSRRAVLECRGETDLPTCVNFYFIFDVHEGGGAVRPRPLSPHTWFDWPPGACQCGNVSRHSERQARRHATCLIWRVGKPRPLDGFKIPESAKWLSSHFRVGRESAAGPQVWPGTRLECLSVCGYRFRSERGGVVISRGVLLTD